MSNFEHIIIPVNDDSVTIKDDELFSHFVESNVGHKLTQKERNMKLFCSATTIDQALTEVNSDISENLKNHLDNITRQYYINNYDLYCDSTFSEKESKLICKNLYNLKRKDFDLLTSINISRKYGSIRQCRFNYFVKRFLV